MSTLDRMPSCFLKQGYPIYSSTSQYEKSCSPTPLLSRIFRVFKKLAILVSMSVSQFSCSVLSGSLQPHWLQQARTYVHHQSPEFTQTHVYWVGDPIQPSHPLSSPSLPPSIFPRIRVFSNESVLHSRWLKYWDFQLQHQCFQCIFRTDFL